ncbi:hypothetical protein Shal_2136 [Shewanella halifaxensis HAW-EB4]|uniref:DUF2254 domain-containing protein n=2 Tax=Shewanella halifaxensis TaxID=271098 RepID=B0TTX7_SHEHH|nr:hypothetical protein Shal_2136 [Shewanella halifaxensis HAW-EB4]
MLRCKDFVDSKKKEVGRIVSLAKTSAISFFYSLRNYCLKQKGVLLVLMSLITFKASMEASSLLNGEVPVDQLKAISLTIGGGLLGFTAIVFSLLLFSLQINLQRLRYLDFYRFSADRHVLGYLLSCLIVSISIIAASLFIVESSSGQHAALMFWAVVLFTFLLIFSYKRAIQLIDPIEQVRLIESEVDSSLERWGKVIERQILADKIAPIESLTNKDFDSLRWQLCRRYPTHQQAVFNSIDSLCSMTKVYTELNDYIVARNTLTKIIFIIDRYMRFRQNTFIEGSPFMSTSVESEPVFNYALERVGQSTSDAISADDKEWIQICFEVFSHLAQNSNFYKVQHGYQLGQQITSIIYYLTSGVKETIPLKNNDVMINASRSVGGLATALLKTASYDNLQQLDKSLLLLGSLSISKGDITVINDVMQRYGDIVFLLLFSEGTDAESEAQSISTSIHFLGKLHLQQGGKTSFNLGYVNGVYGFGETSLSVKLSQQAQILLSDTERFKSEITSLIEGICLWLKVSFNDRYELYQLDQEADLDLFHYLYSLSDTMLKILLTLTSEITEHQLRHDAYTVINREIIALCEIREDKEVFRRIDSYDFMNSLFNLHRLIGSLDTQSCSSVLTINILKLGFKAASINSDHGLLVKAICAAAIISVNNNEQSLYRGLIDKNLNEFSGHQKVCFNALPKLEYLGRLGRFEKGRTMTSYPRCTIERFCHKSLTNELREEIKYSIEAIKLNAIDKEVGTN